MYSNSSEFEKLWFLYKTDAKDVSINSCRLIHDIPYRNFNVWFVRTRKKIVLVQIEGTPSSDSFMKAFPTPVCGETVLRQFTA